MGTRLYPMTESHDVLEDVAGVPRGTMERLEPLRKKFSEATGRYLAALGTSKAAAAKEVTGEIYNEIHDDRDLGRLDHLLTFGWGKFRMPEGVTYDGDLSSGGTTDPRSIRVILATNGLDYFDPALLTGLEWG